MPTKVFKNFVVDDIDVSANQNNLYSVSETIKCKNELGEVNRLPSLFFRDSTKNFKRFQTQAAWLITLSVFVLWEEDNCTLKEVINNPKFKSRVSACIKNKTITYNENVHAINSILNSRHNYKPDYPISFQFAKTIEEREAFLDLTVADLKTVCDDSQLQYKKRKLSVKGKITANSSNIVDFSRNWVQKVKGKEPIIETFDKDSSRKIIAHVFIRTSHNLYEKVTNEENRNTDIIEYLAELSPINAFDKVGEQHIAKYNAVSNIFNLLGKEYIENYMRMSRLYAVLDCISYPRKFTSRASYDWVEKFIAAILGEKPNNKDKDSALDFVYEVYTNFEDINILIREIRQNKEVFDKYKDGDIPLHLLLSMLEIDYKDNNEKNYQQEKLEILNKMGM